MKGAEPKYKQKLQEFENLQTTLSEYQDAVNEIQDQVFADFCKRLGYDNIRSYEAQQGTIQQEGAQKKLEFDTQKSRLESRISFEQQQLNEAEDRIKTLELRSRQDEALIKQLQAEQQSSQNDLDTLMVELDQLTEQLEQLKSRHAQKSEKVTEQRREVQKRSKHVDGTLKTISGLEADRQLNAASRYTLLRRCKLEDISVPLDEESRGLDQLPLDDVIQGNTDAMDIDGDGDGEPSTLNPSEVQTYGIEIDFDELDEDLRQVSLLLSCFGSHSCMM